MNQREAQGYALSIFGSFLFACFPLYVQLLDDIYSITILLHRVVWQFVISCLLLIIFSRSAQFITIIRSRRRLLMHLLTAPLVGLQWWLFLWAPITGHTVELAIGYLVLPITLVAAGAIVFSESLSPLKISAVLIAAIGMMLELLMSGNVSWVSAVVFLGYPPYFMLHRKMKSPSALDALLIESLIVSIACLAWMTFVSPAQIIPDSAETLALLAGLGALALTGMLCLLGAGLRLPMNVFGLLGYLEPVLIMVVALFFLKENIVPQKLFAYLCFGLAVLFVFYEGLMQMIRMRQP